jgi:hypothetical protein
VVAAAVGLTVVVCEACGSSMRNSAAGGNEWVLLPIGGDDEANGSVRLAGEKVVVRSAGFWEMEGWRQVSHG